MNVQRPTPQVEHPIRPAPLTDDAALALAERRDTAALMAQAAALRDAAFGAVMTYSRKVFIPLTHLCRDSCHYCTFATPPRRGEPAYMSPEAVLAVARAGAAAGCTEALFTLGDKPELRYPAAARRARRARLRDDPRLSPRRGEARDRRDRAVAASQSRRDDARGHGEAAPGRRVDGADAGDRVAAALGARRRAFRLAGQGSRRPPRDDRGGRRARHPLHDGASDRHRRDPPRAHRGDAGAACPQRTATSRRSSSSRSAPSRTRAWRRAPDAGDDELLWTLAVARLVFGGDMNIQTPPNLAPRLIGEAIRAGIDDWGGISPVTPDFVNPEAPWPHVDALADRACAARARAGAAAPALSGAMSATRRDGSTARCIRPCCARAMRTDSRAPTPGRRGRPTFRRPRCRSPADRPSRPRSLDRILAKAEALRRLLRPRSKRCSRPAAPITTMSAPTADRLRARAVGDTVTYVVNRNINYTNVCSYRCAFCAFSKGKSADHLRGPAYDLDHRRDRAAG